MAIREAEYAWPDASVPGKLEFVYPVSETQKKIIFDTLEKEANLQELKSASLSALQPVNGLVGKYQLTLHNEHYFVSVSERKRGFDEEKQVIDYLLENEMQLSNYYVIGLSFLNSNTNFYLSINKFLPGEHFGGGIDQLRQLCIAVKQCHRLLKKYPGASRISQNTLRRINLLLDSEKLLRDELMKDGRNMNSAMMDIMNASDLSELEASHAQVVHGEIHRGNVIFIDNQAVLIDFEECVHSYFSPLWDVAYLFQRFCLFDWPNEHQYKERLSVIKSYFDLDESCLFHYMRLAIKLIILVAHYNDVIGSYRTPLREYDKFIKLYAQIDYYQGV